MNGITKTLMAVVGLLAIIMFVMYAPATLNLPAGTTAKLIVVLPGLLLFFIGIGILVTQGVSVFALPGFGLLGIGVAFLLESIQTNAIYPIVSVGGATIAQYQWIIIILCTMIGGVIAAMSRDR